MEKNLVLSDLHVGSDYGLCPKDKIENAFQQWAFEKFDSVVQCLL